MPPPCCAQVAIRTMENLGLAYLMWDDVEQATDLLGQALLARVKQPGQPPQLGLHRTLGGGLDRHPDFSRTLAKS